MFLLPKFSTILKCGHIFIPPLNTDFCSFSAFKRFISDIDLWTVWNFTDLYCVVLLLCVFVPHWLLFNYLMYCRGTIKAIRAWLLTVIFSVLNVLVVLCFETHKADEIMCVCIEIRKRSQYQRLKSQKQCHGQGQARGQHSCSKAKHKP